MPSAKCSSHTAEPKGEESKENVATDSKTYEGYYGYDLYPERRGGKFKPTVTQVLLGDGREYSDKMKCEKNVYSCVRKSPLVKLMIAALKSSGCPINIRRHISCEVCDASVTGGYDPILNQVVICQNRVKKEGVVQGILTHEMIHMFDYCQNDLDFRNIDHLACTEIRAANLAHCSFMSAWSQGYASPFNVKQTHQECVKSKAARSVMVARGVDVKTALMAIDRVFDRCYNDLEPVGRRIRRNSNDMFKAYNEAHLYGYD